MSTLNSCAACWKTLGTSENNLCLFRTDQKLVAVHHGDCSKKYMSKHPRAIQLPGFHQATLGSISTSTISVLTLPAVQAKGF